MARLLADAHGRFREAALTQRRFTIEDLEPLLKKRSSVFKVREAARSTQDRPIYALTAGRGPQTVLLWSQMHGDEPTATMALFDIFNFLESQEADFRELRERILAHCTLTFVPMLNPDGAAAWTRRTALGIDMNRDARRLQTPEGRLLRGLQQQLQPHFAFNLHDQSPRYSAGKTRHVAAVSLLATALDEARSLNSVRRRSMQLVVGMNRALQALVPGHVGRYDDAFEPRAFGDNIQLWGSSLVLVESGGWPDDPEKQHIRMLNFVCILSALDAIATGAYASEAPEAYAHIPQNESPLYDLLIRNLTLLKQGRKVVADVAVNRLETPLFDRKEKWYVRGTVEDLGDLSTFYGLQELDATDLHTDVDLKNGLKADFTLFNTGGRAVYRVGNGTLRALN